MFGSSSFSVFIDTCFEQYNNHKLPGYSKYNEAKQRYDVFITDPYISKIGSQSKAVYIGFIANGKEDGLFVTDPAFIQAHDEAHKYFLKLKDGYVERLTETQLKDEDIADTAKAFAASILSNNLIPIKSKPFRYTKESVKRIFMQPLNRFLQTPLAYLPGVLDELLKYCDIFNITDDLERLAAKMASPAGHNGGDYLVNVALMNFLKEIPTVKEGKGYKPLTLELFDGTKVTSLREHPDLKLGFSDPVYLEDNPTCFVLGFTGEYNSACACAFPIMDLQLLQGETSCLIVFNRLFCHLHPEFKKYTAIMVGDKLYFFDIDPSDVKYPMLNSVLIRVPTLGFEQCEFPFMLHSRFMGQERLCASGTIATTERQPLEDVFSPRVMAIKEEGSSYSVYTIADPNSATKKKGKSSRKSKNKAKGEYIGEIISSNQKTGWIYLNRKIITEYPDFRYRFVYSDGNKIRVFDTDTKFPGDAYFYTYRCRQLALSHACDVLDCFNKPVIEETHGRTIIAATELLDDASFVKAVMKGERIAPSPSDSAELKSGSKPQAVSQDSAAQNDSTGIAASNASASSTSAADSNNTALAHAAAATKAAVPTRKAGEQATATAQASAVTTQANSQAAQASTVAAQVSGASANAQTGVNSRTLADAKTSVTSGASDNAQASVASRTSADAKTGVASGASANAQAGVTSRASANAQAGVASSASTNAQADVTSGFTANGTAADHQSEQATNASHAASNYSLGTDDGEGRISDDGSSYQLCGVNSVVDAPKLNLIPGQQKFGGYGYFFPKRENGVLINKPGELVASVVPFSRNGWLSFETDYLIPRPQLSDYFVYSFNDKLWFFNANVENESAFANTLDFDTYSFLKFNKDSTAQLKRTHLSESEFIYEEEPVLTESELRAAEIDAAALESSVTLLDDSDAQASLEGESGNEIGVPLSNAIAAEASLKTANDCIAESVDDNKSASGRGQINDFDEQTEVLPLFSGSKSRQANLRDSDDLGPSPADDEDLLVSDMRLDEQVEEELKLEGGILDKIIDDAQSGSATAQASQPVSNPPKLNLKLVKSDDGYNINAIEPALDVGSKSNEILAGSLIGTKDNGWVLFEPMYIGLHPELQYLIVHYQDGKFEYFDACSYPDDPNFEEFGIQRFDTEYLNKVLASVNATTPIAQDGDDTDDIADVDPLDTADFDDAAAAMVDAAVHDAFEGKENFGIFARDCDPAAGCRSFLAPDGSQIDALTDHPALCLQLKHDHLSGYMLLDDKGRFAGTLVSQIPGSLCGWVRFDSEYLKLNPKLSDFHVFFDQDKIYFYPRVEIDDEDFRLYQSAPEDVEHRLMQQSADLSDSEPAVAALKEMGAYTSMPCYTEIVKSRVEVESDEEFKQLCADGLKTLSEPEHHAPIIPELEDETIEFPQTKFDDKDFAKNYLADFNDRVLYVTYIHDITIVMMTEHKGQSGKPKRVGVIDSKSANGLIRFDRDYMYTHPELAEAFFMVEQGQATIKPLYSLDADELDHAACTQYVNTLQESFAVKYDLVSIDLAKAQYQASLSSTTAFENSDSFDFSLEKILQARPNAEVKIIGGAFVDVTLGLDKMPVTGGDSYARELNKGVGGCALNVAHALRTLDINHQLQVPIGNGPYADIVKQQLLADGYTEANFIYDEDLKKDCGYCMCMVDRDGERTFVVVPGIENHVKREWFDNLDLSNAGMVYISGFDLNERNGEIYLTRLREELNKPENQGKCTVFFDAGARLKFISRESFDILLSLNPILHLNRMELELLTGQRDIQKGINSLASRTSAPVIVSLDKDGCCVAYKSFYGTFKVQQLPVVDATGAGDCHSAGIIAALMKGKCLNEAINAGNALAAECISHIGARLNIENRDLKAFKKQYLDS